MEGPRTVLLPSASLNVRLLFRITLVTLYSAAAAAFESEPHTFLVHAEHSHSGSHHLNREVFGYWSKMLPTTVMPRAIRRLVSPLSPIQVQSFKESMRLGHLVASADAASAFCSSAHLRCGSLDGLAGTFNLLEEDKSEGATDLQANSWFLEEHLTAGTATGTRPAMEVQGSRFSDRLQQATGGSFLPRELADLFRLFQRDLLNILTQFHIPENSFLADAMRNTLSFCVRASSRPRGTSQAGSGVESGTCVTSLEDLVLLVGRMLRGGSGSRSGSAVKALSSTSFPASNKLLSGGRFKVVKVEEKGNEQSKYLSCHSMLFPFQVAYCHHIPKTKLYSVTLESIALPGYTVSNVVLCHMDTSQWSPNHVAFKLLGKQPGQTEACRWSNSNAFAFVLPA